MLVLGELSDLVGNLKIYSSFNSSPIILPALRSISSKLVPSDERGIMFALISACDKSVPIISGVLYSQTYLATMKIYPAGIFWVTIVSQAMVFVTIM